MDIQKLRRLSRLWQKRLRLQDWRTTLTLTPDMDDNNLGFTDADTGEMTADIRILSTQSDQEIEATLVHELLHLRLFPFESGPDYVITEGKETAINLLAATLVRAYQRRKKL